MSNRSFTLSAIPLAIGGCSPFALAAPLLLSQAPPTLPHPPAPNIIVSVDNSTSMGRAGIADLQAALRATFSAENIPDNQIRLAWQSMHHCNTLPGRDTTDAGACKGYNGMRRLTGAHRSSFFNWIDSLSMRRGTPSHYMMENAGEYLSATGLGINSPWASNPGFEESPVLSCRRSYHILMTDGEYGHAWTGQELDTSGPPGTPIVRDGNADGTAISLPDGTPYPVDATNAQTRLYRDTWGSSTLSTLSDLAFHYWSRDLQKGMTNDLKPTPAQRFPRENFGTVSEPAELDPYWNPRNNPATWQHMVTYTIGFKDAASWAAASDEPTWMGSTHAGLGPLIRGDKKWASPFCNATVDGPGNLPCDKRFNYSVRRDARKMELWHAALNSRGRFVPAPDAQSLVNAFRDILADLTAENRQARVSIAASSGSLRSDGRVYLASYNMQRFSGEVEAYQLKAGSLQVDTQPAWTTSTVLDAASMNWTGRRIFSQSETGGIRFEWASLDEKQKAALRGPDTDAVGAQRVAYLRGDRTLEGPSGGFRERASRMGTIVNSNLWTVGAPRRMAFAHPGHVVFRRAQASRPETVYIGANGGMLHGFDAATGAERFAYVPLAAYAGLRDHTSPQYTHRLFVDGHPFTGDADLSGPPSDSRNPPEPKWRTVLVGSLGGGGRGYFVMDVTDPTNMTAGSVLLDRTFATTENPNFDGHEDVGHLYGAPVTDAISGGRSEQIVKLNNGRWAVVLGNGVNSSNERPVLLIQYLDGDKSLKRLVAHSATQQSNGLAPPRLLDVDGNGTMDIAYAGDLQGQLWKFDLSSGTDIDWGVSAWGNSTAPCKDATTCQPLFVATDGASPARAQAITTAPLAMAHPLGGIQVMFGTGQNIQPGDPANTAVQTIYSVWDMNALDNAEKNSGPPHLRPITGGRASLVQQGITTAVKKTAPGGELVDTIYSNSTDNTVAYSRTDPRTHRGWFMDLPLEGERVLQPPGALQGQRVLIPSLAPSPTAGGESCEPKVAAGQARATVLNMITGRPPATPVFFSSDSTMDLSKASSVLLASDELVSITSFPVAADFLGISGDGYGTSRGTKLGETLSNDEGGAQTCAGNGCVTRNGVRLGTSRGARADWREVR